MSIIAHDMLSINEKTNWKKLIQDALEDTGESYSELISTLSQEELEEEFDSGYGKITSKPFTAWGKEFVYFPLEYDGSERVGYAPRNPGNITMRHQGGDYLEIGGRSAIFRKDDVCE